MVVKFGLLNQRGENGLKISENGFPRGTFYLAMQHAWVT